MNALVEKYKDQLSPKILEDVDNNIKGLSQKDVKRVLDMALEEYNNAKIEPGESVGIISAESIGEPSTQMTLNTFHFAGVAEMNVTVGLPRIIEILDGRKEISTPMMEIYLKSPYNKGKDIRKVAQLIKETTFDEIISEISISISDLSIEISLDKEKMKQLSLTNGQLSKILSKSIKNILIKDDKNTIILKLKGKNEDLNELYRLKEKIKGVYIKGVKRIKQVLPVKRDEEFVIITAGTNLKEVFKLEYVDFTRTTSNNIYEIAEVLGIEAARRALIEEIFKVIESQGLNVDIRHIMLVSDVMCSTGRIKGITRYGVVSDKSSVLARASFETPIKHIMEASLVGEVDNLSSVIENVMLNQPIPVGTGMPGLVTKTKK